MNRTKHGRYRRGLGTLAWGAVTAGRLRRSDRIRQVLAYLGVRLTQPLRSTRGKRISIDLEELTPPDSPEALRAAEICREFSSEALANHCLRSYFWGAIIARLEGHDYDPEVFFVSAMLHDLGLTDHYAFSRPQLDCFALEGAELALELTQEWAWTEERRARMAEAIALHVNVSVPSWRFGCEAHLLHAATALDVGGINRERIHSDDRTAVLQKVPRLGLGAELTRALGAQVQRRPDCRMAFLFSNGFGRAVKAGDRVLGDRAVSNRIKAGGARHEHHV